MNYINSLYAADMPHRAVAVYRYLKDRADKEGKCYPSIDTIASYLKLSRSTVKRAIDDLTHAGQIRKEQRWRESGGRSSLMYYLQ
jgi:predicted transcriptional regulator